VNTESDMIRIAFGCNILGTVMLAASMFTNHPLFFMVVVMGGVGLLGIGFLIWLREMWRGAPGPPPADREPS
jgi:hypothetical protein